MYFGIDRENENILFLYVFIRIWKEILKNIEVRNEYFINLYTHISKLIFYFNLS